MLRNLTICLALVLLSAGTAAADRFELSLASGTRWMTSESVDTLSADDAHTIAGIGGGVRLDGLRPFGFDIFVGGDYLHQSLSGTTFRRIESDMSMHVFRATARAERWHGTRFAGFARFSMGYTTVSLGFTDRLSTAARPTRDRAHAASSTLGLGADVVVLRYPTFKLALRTEVEYDRTSSLHFAAEPDSGEGDVLTIPITAASLGDVDVSGLGLRIGLVGRF